MAAINWEQVLPLIGTLIGGGAMGAIINHISITRRNRIPPIGRQIDITPIFRKRKDTSSLSASIALTFIGKTATYDNLFIADVILKNISNKDFVRFNFDIELKGGDQCVHVEDVVTDISHKFILKTMATPSTPMSKLNFDLFPFNRGNTYQFKLYIVIPEQNIEPNEIKLSSKESNNFINLPLASETILKAARNIIIDLNPISVGPFTIKTK